MGTNGRIGCARVHLRTSVWLTEGAREDRVGGGPGVVDVGVRQLELRRAVGVGAVAVVDLEVADDEGDRAVPPERHEDRVALGIRHRRGQLVLRYADDVQVVVGPARRAVTGARRSGGHGDDEQAGEGKNWGEVAAQFRPLFLPQVVVCGPAQQRHAARSKQPPNEGRRETSPPPDGDLCPNRRGGRPASVHSFEGSAQVSRLPWVPQRNPHLPRKPKERPR